jgi:formylmethanofuran dehydrogenase subunit B
VANELLERGEVDACLFVGSESCGDLSIGAQQTVKKMPTIALDYPNAAAPLKATVQITTAIYGIHAPGTAYRMDEVPIPLRRLAPSDLPTDDEVLGKITTRLRDSFDAP